MERREKEFRNKKAGYSEKQNIQHIKKLSRGLEPPASALPKSNNALSVLSRFCLMLRETL